MGDDRSAPSRIAVGATPCVARPCTTTREIVTTPCVGSSHRHPERPRGMCFFRQADPSTAHPLRGCSGRDDGPPFAALAHSLPRRHRRSGFAGGRWKADPSASRLLRNRFRRDDSGKGLQPLPLPSRHISDGRTSGAIPHCRRGDAMRRPATRHHPGRCHDAMRRPDFDDQVGLRRSEWCPPTTNRAPHRPATGWSAGL